MQTAALYFFPFVTYSLGPPPYRDPDDDYPESDLLHCLDNLEAREQIDVNPGNVLVVVYGDSWYDLLSQLLYQSLRMMLSSVTCVGMYGDSQQ